eukprot:TRINITY_DN2377_c0_g1_i1.p1 TRINITY_DN2377_c0_g1~~TRINITY_DN2377_c0_g1_i1.p1  ORF type:complete len:157 (-),score=43.62 TRINITY_DN2377_c0_g1_i1:148-579(-)
MATLAEDQRQFFTAEFNKVGKNGMITDINKFGQLMRNLGQLLAPADLQKMMGGPSITLQKFLDLMSSTIAHDDTTADVLEAFKVYDRDGHGMIPITDLKHILVNQGDKLDFEQAETITGRISTTNGSFNFYNIVDQFSKVSGQ